MPSRRGEIPRQGACLLLPRQVPPLGSEEPAPGAVARLQNQVNKGRASVSSRSQLTELDIGNHIYLENIDRVPLYFTRPCAPWWIAAASRSRGG